MSSIKQYDFAILELLPCENNTNTEFSETLFQKIFQRIIKKYKEVFRMNILKRKMRKYNFLDSLTILNKTGQRILIPYTKEELEAIEKSKVYEYIYSMIDEEQIRAIVPDVKLKEYIPEEYIIDGKFLMFLYLKEVLEIARKRHYISRKRMKVLVIDSEDQKIEYLLDEIGEDLNYLTIVTKRREYFMDYVEKVYQETGLLISLISKPLSSPVDGNVIINLDYEQDKNYRYFEKNSIYIELSELSAGESYVVAKRIDITYYNHITMLINGGIVDNTLIQAAICGKPTRICLENPEEFEKYEELKVANLVCKY